MAILQTIKTFFDVRIIAPFLPYCAHDRKRTPEQLENHNYQLAQKGKLDVFHCIVNYQDTKK